MMTVENYHIRVIPNEDKIVNFYSLNLILVIFVPLILEEVEVVVVDVVEIKLVIDSARWLIMVEVKVEKATDGGGGDSKGWWWWWSVVVDMEMEVEVVWAVVVVVVIDVGGLVITEVVSNIDDG